MMLALKNICKSYDGTPLLNDISFQVGEGETLCLLGPSGSGKSTILRIIAGLETAESGTVFWAGKNLASVPAHLREFGLIFQDYALFPHLNVFENVAFGLRMQKLPQEMIRQRVEESLRQVDLLNFAARPVTELSGGEQQRVALARALAPRPRLLLFDEPLGALDRKLREDLLAVLRGILQRSRVPAVYVTHDQEEAFALADRILLLHEGKIVQRGAPAEVYARPVSGWVAAFLGAGNVLEGKVLGEGMVQTSYGDLPLPKGAKQARGTRVTLLLRPHDLHLGGDDAPLRGRVADIRFQENRYRVQLEGGLYFYLPQPVAVGEVLQLEILADKVQIL